MKRKYCKQHRIPLVEINKEDMIFEELNKII